MIRSHSLRPGRPATSLESQSHLNIILHQEYGKTRQTKRAVFIVHNRDSSPNSTAGRIRPGCHAHVFVSMECPGLPESLGHAHEAVSMAPKSLAQHHLRFISWSRGGDQRGVSIEGCPRDSAWRKLMAVSWCFREAGDRAGFDDPRFTARRVHRHADRGPGEPGLPERSRGTGLGGAGGREPSATKERITEALAQRKGAK